MTDDRDTSPPKVKPAAPAADRNARRAASLRDNLLKRKALSRARTARETAETDGEDRRD